MWLFTLPGTCKRECPEEQASDTTVLRRRGRSEADTASLAATRSSELWASGPALGILT